MSKKLTLSKETLRTLDDDAMTHVVGGDTGICVNTVVCNSGVCQSVACNVDIQSVVCNNRSTVCQSVVCGSGILC